MHSGVFFLFAIVSLVAIATPGPTTLLALANGSRLGVRAAGFGVAGAVMSDILLIVAVAVGLGALLTASELLFQTVKWIGVCYLAFLGVQLLRSNSRPDTPVAVAPEREPAPAVPARGRTLFLKSFAVAVTNPKGLLFFSAFLPQFIEPSMPQAPQYTILAITFSILDCAVMLSYAFLGARVMQSFKTSGMIWLNRACGSALLGLAGILALYRKANN